MGQQQSKDEQLYQQVKNGNIEGIKALRREGASLEWFDREGQTPLILACSRPELINIARTLIELGANVNAYRPGCHAGTPLHQAAKSGLHETVRLLLSHGANALVMNRGGKTPLDVARVKGYSFVVRAIESHILFFSGWLREVHGPGFLEALVPQLFSRKIWVVVIPRGSRKPKKPLNLELAIYSSQQDARPSSIIGLWKAKIKEPKFRQLDPTLVIIDKANKKRYKFASANEGDKQQLQWFCNACKGVPQVMHPPLPPHTHTPVVPTIAPPSIAIAPPSVAEDVELAMAISASIQSAMEERPPLLPSRTYLSSGVSNTNGCGISAVNPSHNGCGATEGPAPPSKVSGSGWLDEPAKDANKGWGLFEAGTTSNPPLLHNIPAVAPTTYNIPADNPSHNGQGPMEGPPLPLKASSNGWLDEPAKDAYNGWGIPKTGSSSNSSPHNIPAVASTTYEIPGTTSIPSAPPIHVGANDVPIQNPLIDSSPADLSIPKLETSPTGTSDVKEDGSASSSCVICLDAPVEGACIPCGHMAGCMSCLNEIKAKKWGCPVCRAKIDQVIRLYVV